MVRPMLLRRERGSTKPFGWAGVATSRQLAFCGSEGGRVVAARAGSTAGGGAGAGCAGVYCMVGAAAAVSSENSFNCLVDSIAFGIEHAHFGFDPVADFLVHGVRREAGRVDPGAYRYGDQPRLFD